MSEDTRPKRKITAEFFRTEAGNEPVREWLKGLTAEERQAVGKDVRTTEYGWPLGMPPATLGDGLWEVRTTLQDRIARVTFCIAGAQMILLHDFVKKAQKTPEVELETARGRKKNLEARLREIAKREKKK